MAISLISMFYVCRYDARGALGDLRIYEPPPGGYDLRTILTEEEFKAEQACDDERYQSLYTNEAEESMYHGTCLVLNFCFFNKK